MKITFEIIFTVLLGGILIFLAVFLLGSITRYLAECQSAMESVGY